ncbi:MAG TPA: BMP family ABC transporter substrate-binding protein [Nitriliruptorales bacterium]|nr:BMP family ABC transporter substrate-binding protein [Nitriliruptorales bacterium]
MCALLLVAAACEGDTTPGPGPTASPTAAAVPSGPAGGEKVGIVLAPPTEPLAAIANPAVRDVAERLHELVAADLARVRVLEPPSEPFRGDQMALLADEGVGLVCTLGAEGGDEVTALAPQVPTTRFCLLDGQLRRPPANAVSVGWHIDQGAFIAGAAAALAVPEAAVAVVTGIRSPAADRVRSGFEAGARHVRPDVVVLGIDAAPEGDAGQGEDRSTARQRTPEDRSAVRERTASLLAGDSPVGAVLALGGEATVRGTAEATAGYPAVVLGWGVDVGALLDEHGLDAEVLGSVVKRYDLALPLALGLAGRPGPPVTVLGLQEDAFAFVPGESDRYAAIAGGLRQVVGDLREGRVGPPPP